MLASTAFTIILIHDERPRLTSLLEFLGHSWYRIHSRLRPRMIMIEGNIYFSIFVIDSLTIDEY
jgi:hypothetical protein